MPPRPRRLGIAVAVVSLVLGLAGCGYSDPVPAEERERSRAATPTPTPRAPAGLDPVLAEALAGQPPRATTPGQVVRRIVVAERAIADPATPERVLAAAGHVQQLAYRVLGARPGWDAKVFPRLPRDLRAAARANVDSRREFRSMHYRLSDTLPAWRIVRPAPAEELLRHYRAAERRFGVDWEYLAAINLIETGMGRIRGTSVAGARGPMQFIPPTWAQYGRGDIDDERDAIMAAARYLEARGFTRPGGKPRGLYAYNNHMAYVRGVTDVAEVMKMQPRAFHGYYHWQIYYLSAEGDVLLPEGYERTKSIPVRRYLERNPQA